MNLFCKHDWQLLHETTTESVLEHTKRVTGNAGGSDNVGGQELLCQKKYITLVTCKKCGKLKRFVEKSS